MAKKIIFTFLTLLILYSTAVVAYRLFEPVNNTEYPDEDSSLSYDSLNQYLLSTGEGSTHYVFFYSAVNDNCIYVRNTVLSQVENETGISVSSLFETVDITSLDENMKTARLSDDWNISGYPAFAAITVKNGKPSVVNSLVWTDQKPVTASALEGWMAENDLWTPVSK